MNVNPLLLALPVVFVAAIVVVPVALAALADGLGLHALPQDRRLLLLRCILRESTLVIVYKGQHSVKCIVISLLCFELEQI